MAKNKLSEECRKKISQALIGRKLSEEHKEKIRQALKGRKFTEEWKRKISEAKKGCVFTEEHRKKLSDAHKNKCYMSEKERKKRSERWKGELNPNWKGGIFKNNPDYDKIYYRKNIDKWRFYFLARFHLKRSRGFFTLEEWESKKKEFNYKCAICGISEEELLNKTGMGLTIDHIIPLSKGGTNDITNIQPLCKSCNSKKYNHIGKNTIDNHLDSQRKANEDLTTAIKALLDFLKWQNKNNKQ